MKGAGRPDQAHPGVVGERFGGFLQRARGVTVAVRLDVLSTARDGREQLREHADQAAGGGVLDERAQDRGELRPVDVVGGEVVLDLLEGELRGRAPNRYGNSRSPGRGLGGGDQRGQASQPSCHA